MSYLELTTHPSTRALLTSAITPFVANNPETGKRETYLSVDHYWYNQPDAPTPFSARKRGTPSELRLKVGTSLKFKQHPKLMKVLLATSPAKLSDTSSSANANILQMIRASGEIVPVIKDAVPDMVVLKAAIRVLRSMAEAEGYPLNSIYNEMCEDFIVLIKGSEVALGRLKFEATNMSWTTIYTSYPVLRDTVKQLLHEANVPFDSSSVTSSLMLIGSCVGMDITQVHKVPNICPQRSHVYRKFAPPLPPSTKE